METYLSACAKAASVAANKTAASSVAEDTRKCGHGLQKSHFPGVGGTELLDLPLGVKLPVIPGSKPTYYTTKLNEKLFQPSYGFNLTDPYCRLLGNRYNSLHDPHLRAYHTRKDILERLKKGGYITSNNKVVCNLKEFNKYRQYLTSLKLDFERNYEKEQKMIAKQVSKLQRNSQMPAPSDVAQFQNWLLQDPRSFKDQERLLRCRYLDMIRRELEQRECTAEEQRRLQLDRQLWGQARRKLSLRRKIEEEWKHKEMLLLTKIGEDAEREARLEEQRWRSREERGKKKQALLEKKMAYHLQKMPDNGSQREDTGKNTSDFRGQDGAHCDPNSPKKKKKSYDDMKLIYPVGDQNTNRGVSEPIVNQHLSNPKNDFKTSSSPVVCQSTLRENGTEQKNDELVTKKSSTCNDRGAMHIQAQTSLTRNFPRAAQSHLSPTKVEKEINADWSETQNKRSGYICESEPQAPSRVQGIFPSHVPSNTQQNLLQNCSHKKVTSQELKSIIQNIMTWVVATVTSILYPAITKYEERLQNNAYPVSDDSVLSSDSSSSCSTCSEEFAYGSYPSATTNTFWEDPCAFAVDVSVKRPSTPLKPPSAHGERADVEKTYHTKGQPMTPELKYNKTNMICAHPKIRSCKSDSYLLAPLETGTKKSKDATTETDGLQSLEVSGQKAKDETKNLKKMFVNFKCHLQEETKLILESIFQEIMSDLTQAIPSISSVTAEVFVDGSEPEKRGSALPASVDIDSAASEIVENMMEKLQCAVEKTCAEMFSQEDTPVSIKPSLTPTREDPTPSHGRPFRASPSQPAEPTSAVAADTVHAILQRLVTFAPCKQEDLPHLEHAANLFYQQQMTGPTHTFLENADEEKYSPEPEASNLIVKEEIQKLMSDIFSQSSLVGCIEEVISAILSYVQTELDNEKLIATEETVEFLQLLDDIFIQLHREPVNTGGQRRRQSRLRSPPDTEEKYRPAGTRLASVPGSRRPFPPVNVPGVVLYSEDEHEETDVIVKNVLDASLKHERAKAQEQDPEHWVPKGNTCFEHKRNSKPPTQPASLRSKVTFCDEGLKTDLPHFNDKEILKKKPCLNKDILIFSQDQKYQVQKASENVIKSILTEMLKDISPVSPGHLGSDTDKETSVLVSEKSRGLPLQEGSDQMFSVSEVHTMAQEITDAVLHILHKAPNRIPNNTTSSVSSFLHQTSPESSDVPNTVKEAPNEKPLKIWFDSKKKMKYLTSLNLDPEKPSLLKSRETELNVVDDIADKIITTVLKRLKSLVYPKLQVGFRAPPAEPSSLHSQLSTYTAKVINIVLRAVQNELGLSEKSLNIGETDNTKSLKGEGFLADTDKLESLISNLKDDIVVSPLLACIWEMLSSGHSDQSSISLPSDKPRPSTSYGSDNVKKQINLPSRQDKNSFLKYLAAPCALHSDFNGKECRENTRLQVLDSIGETLYEMLCELPEAHPDSQPPCSKLDREKVKEKPQMATKLQSDIQLISKAILEYILEQLCSVDMDTTFPSSGTEAVSESLDIDNQSFNSIIEEMAKCIDMISGIVSRMVQEGDKEVTKRKAETIAPVSSKVGSSEEIHTSKLKATAAHILNTVFAKLEGFASGNLETLGSVGGGTKKSCKTDLTCVSPSVPTATREERLLSALPMHAKKVSSVILKAIQTELTRDSLDLRTSVETLPPEKQKLRNAVNLILDAVSSVMVHETESEERDVGTHRYRPTYGNFLPGGAGSDSLPEDAAHPEEEFSGERIALREETKSDSLQEWVLEGTLNKIEVKLKEAQKSPVIPIVRNILSEIFQGVLVNQLHGLSPSRSSLSGIPHNVDEPIAQTPVPFIDKKTAPLVSEADVIIMADDVIRTIFHKLCSVAMAQRNASGNRYKTIPFLANVSFHEHAYRGKSSVIVLDENPGTIQSRYNAGEQATGKVAGDIFQTILTNLEAFATSKVISLFCPQISLRVPEVLPLQEDKSPLRKALSAKDSYSDQISCCSVDCIMSEKTNSCQLSLNKLNTHATEVASKILQGLKHELDRERETLFSTHNIVVSEEIASQIVNTVLDIVSSKGKCETNNSDKELHSDQQEGIIEKMFHKTEYRKALQFQIQDTTESILCDIYEKTLYQNNLSFVTPSLQCSTAGKRSGENSEMSIEDAHKIIPKLSVPKSDVILLSSDIVDTVLHSLGSVIMLGIKKAEDPTSARWPLTFCDMFPQIECQQPCLTGSKSERETECFSSYRNLQSVYAVASQVTVIEKEDTKKSTPDPCEENANFITKSIFNQLESFATERIDSLITLAFQPEEKSSVSPELENCKQDDSIFQESSQSESNVNVLKISAETVLSQELTDSPFVSYRGKLGSTIHLSQASLKEYADIIASVILNCIKHDIDLEIQKSDPHTNNISSQGNLFVSKIVNSILKILNDKRSVKEISFYPKDNPCLFPQLTASHEILLGQREQDKNTGLSLFSWYPLEPNQMTLENESQRIVLEEIFMQNGDSKEKTALLRTVKEVLSKVYQRITEIKGHLPPLNETPYFVSNSKIKTSDTTQKNYFPSHIHSVANDIVEIVLGEMYSVVVTSLYESKKREEACDNNDGPPRRPSRARETKQGGTGSSSTGHVTPQVYPYTGHQNVRLLENSLLQYSPLQVARNLVQMVLSKITNFASFHLEEVSSSEDCSDGLKPLRLHNSKVNPKDSLQPGFKTSFKAKSKVTPFPKFRKNTHLGPRGAKAKSKPKLGPGEKTPKVSLSKTAVGLPHIPTAGDAKSLPETKLPSSELKKHAMHILSNILQTTVKEFEKAKQTRAMVNVKSLPSSQIMAASNIVTTVLQGLHATNNHNFSHPIKLSHLDALKHSQRGRGAGSFAQTQARFYLENVSSQLEQIFPKDSIFKKMFDKWQAEPNDVESGKCNLLMTAESALTAISVKAKEFEYSLSLLNFPHLEDCESRFQHCIKGTSTRAEDTKAQINMFGKEIVEMLFEKLQLFLSQMPTPDSKETLASREEHIITESKYGFPTKNIFSRVPIYNMNTKDHISLESSKQLVLEVVERVLNMLESFVDLQFKHISKYEFSELAKMPIENLFPVPQSILSRKIFPELKPLKNFSDESKLSTIISKENVQNTLLQIQSFHSELPRYAVNTISDMLGTIKNEVDREMSQVEPPGNSTLNDSVVTSEIIGILIDQCAHFSESLIKNLPKKSLFPEVENTYIVNQVELATNMKIPRSALQQVSLGKNPSQISVPGLVFHPEEDMEEQYRTSSNLPSYARASAEDTIKSSEPVESSDSEHRPTCSRTELQGYDPRERQFDQATKGHSSLPEGSVLQQLFKKVSDSAEESLKQGMAFIDMGKGENPRAFHFEPPKPEQKAAQTTVSPLKICLAAENIVNTILSSYGFPSQSPTNETMETMKPFFMSTPNPGGQKNKKKDLLRICDKRISCIPEEERKNSEDNREDSVFLQKQKKKRSPEIKTLKDSDVIAFSDHELGPSEIHLVARHVAMSVVTYFKSFKTRVSSEKMSMVSALSKEKYETKQPLRSIYNDSLLYQFCEYLTESVICHLISSIPDSTKDGREKEKTWESQNAAFNKVISIDSQVFGNKSIYIGELALSISEIITNILFNNNIIEVDLPQKMFSLKTRYIYCPGVAAVGFDSVFQDLVLGVIHVLSKEIGITQHFESNGRNQSFSMIRNNSMPIGNKRNITKRQTGCRDWELAADQNDHLIQKSKLNYLAYKLDSLVSNLKTCESKEVVNKVFNIVLDLFLPDEHQGEAMDSDEEARKVFSSLNGQQSNSILGNKLGLTPKSVFLLNVVCEKLIRTLLEKCTNTLFLDNGSLSDEVSTEEGQLLKILQSVEDEEFDYCTGAIDCEQFQEGYMSDLLENLTEMDLDLLLSDVMLTIISHSLVKSLMDKLSQDATPPKSTCCKQALNNV